MSERILRVGVFPPSDSAQLGTADRLKVIGHDIRAECRFLELLVMGLVRVLGNEGANLIHPERQGILFKRASKTPIISFKNKSLLP